MGESEQRPVAIIGAGVVGTSVAFACAAAGEAVVLIDREDKDWAQVRRSLRAHRRLRRLSLPQAPPVDTDAIETLIATYLDRREAGETFLQCYRRLGAAAFKETLYAAA